MPLLRSPMRLCAILLLFLISSVFAFASGSIASQPIAPQPSLLSHLKVGQNVGSAVTVDSFGNAFVGSRDGKVYLLSEGESNSALFSGGTSARVLIDLGSPIASSAALSHNEAILYVTTLSGQVAAVNIATGSVLWRNPESPLSVIAQSHTSPAVDLNGNVYFGDNQGRFYSVKPDGTELHLVIQLPGESVVGSSPTVGVDGLVYFGSESDGFYHFNPADGSLVQLDSSPNASASSSVSNFGTVTYSKIDEPLATIPSSSTLTYSPESKQAGTLGEDLTRSVLLGNVEPVVIDGYTIAPYEDTLRIYKDGVVVDSFQHEGALFLSAPAVASTERSGYLIYLASSSPIFERNGFVVALRFDGSTLTPEWFYAFQGDELLGHFVAAPTIDYQGNVHVVSSFGEYFKFQGEEIALSDQWTMFGGSASHQRVLKDFDQDGCPDSIDQFNLNDSECLDSDQDGIGDNADTDDDNDGSPDAWEEFILAPEWANRGMLGNPLIINNANDDFDNDGLNTYLEYVLGLDPWVANNQDTDGDGYIDVWESHYTSPTSSAFDPSVNNNTPDASNNDLRHSDDFDNDGLTNIQEHDLLTNPYLTDSDGDGISDRDEVQTGSNYYFSDFPCRDNTGDGIIDTFKSEYSLHPLFNDAGLDFDCDGYSNLTEINAGEDFLNNEYDSRQSSSESSAITHLLEGNELPDINSAGDLYVHSSNDLLTLFDSPLKYHLMSRDVNTGELSYLKTSTINSRGALIDWVAHPELPILYDLVVNPATETLSIRVIQFDLLSETWSINESLGLDIPFYDSAMGVVSSDLLAFDYSTNNAHLRDLEMKVSHDGRFLYIPSSGQTGVLVFELNLETGLATFRNQILKSFESSFVNFVESDQLTNYVYVADEFNLRTFRQNADGTLSLLAQSGLQIIDGTRVTKLRPGVQEGQVLVLRTSNVLRPMQYDSNSNSIVLYQDNIIGFDYSASIIENQLVLFGRESYFWNGSEFTLLSRNNARREGSNSFLTSRKHSPVISRDGLHVYYLDSRALPNGVVGYPMDYLGKGRPDQDGDGVEDLLDDYIDDPRFHSDSDGDGAPDGFTPSCDLACQNDSGFTPIELDQDSDNDGYPDIDNSDNGIDETDHFPTNPYAWKDSDLDGLPDFLVNCDTICRSEIDLVVDQDDDNDGYPDDIAVTTNSLFPQDDLSSNPDEWIDTDGDGIGNNDDEDDDNDGIPDVWELLHGLDPYNAQDALENGDLEKFGSGLRLSPDGLNNLEEYLAGSLPFDPDSDTNSLGGDGIPDHLDALPLHPNEWLDLDNDGIGDNSDPDKDGDGLLDAWELQFTDQDGNSIFSPEVHNSLDADASPDSHPNADPDSDGLNNLEESTLGTNPFAADTDDDLLPDGFEVAYQLSASNQYQEPCSYTDGRPNRYASGVGLRPIDVNNPDTYLDNDCDRYSNLDEYRLGTDPLKNEFDSRVTSDETAPGQTIASVSSSDLDSNGDAIGLSFQSNRTYLGDFAQGEYIFAHKSGGRLDLFKRELSSGALSYAEITSPTMQFNVSSHPTRPWIFSLRTAADSQYEILRWTLSQDANALESHVAASFPHITNNIFLGINNEPTVLPIIEAGGEAVDQRTITDLIISPNGRFLFVPSAGRSGVLVYKVDLENGSLDFAYHLKGDATHTKPALILPINEEVVYIAPGGASSERVVSAYTISSNGVLGNGSVTGIPLASSQSDQYERLMPAADGTTIFAKKTNDDILKISFDAQSAGSLTSISVATESTLNDYTGALVQNQLFQFGASTYRFFEAEPENELDNRFEEFSTIHPGYETGGFYFFGPPENPRLTLWKGSSVISNDQSHVYFVDLRDNTDHRIVGFNTDFIGVERPDSDGDGVEDILDAFPNDPAETSDADQDGIGDNSDPDDDNDGLLDAWEIANGYDPLVANVNIDSDGDGLFDLEEQALGTDPRNPDSDGDLIPDSWEFVLGLNPNLADSHLDPDQDSYSNLIEFRLGTPLFYNTFVDQALAETSRYLSGTLTTSGLETPLMDNAVRAIVNPNQNALYVLASDGIHQFTLDTENGSLAYLTTISFDASLSLSAGIDHQGKYLYVFRESASGEFYRETYEVSSTSDAELGLVSSTSIMPRDVGLPPQANQERADSFGVGTKVLISSDAEHLYVPSVSLGFMHYQVDSEGGLTFVDYQLPETAVVEGAEISSDARSGSVYVIDGPELEIYDRNIDDGTLSLRETLLTSDGIESFVDVAVSSTDKEWVLSSQTKLEVYVEDNSNALTSKVTSAELNALVEINTSTVDMVYSLSNGTLSAKHDIEGTYSDYDSIALEANSVAAIPLDLSYATDSNYLFVLSQTQLGEKQLAVYMGAVKGRGHIDSDGDGYFDINDLFPYNSNEFEDVDGDGCGDNFVDKFVTLAQSPQPELECLDTDGDGLSNELADDDDDNDGYTDEFENRYSSNVAGCENSLLDSVVFNFGTENYDSDAWDLDQEIANGTSPCLSDTDGDGEIDSDDAYPNQYSKPPAVTLNGLDTLVFERGAIRPDPGATAIDDIYGNVTRGSSGVTPGVISDWAQSVVFDEVGSYTASYTITITEPSGFVRSNTVQRAVTIVDRIAPVITLDAPAIINVESGPNYSSFYNFVTYSRLTNSDYLEARVADAHSSDGPVVVTSGLAGNLQPGFSGISLNPEAGDAINCGPVIGPVACYVLRFESQDSSGNLGFIEIPVNVYPAEAPNFGFFHPLDGYLASAEETVQLNTPYRNNPRVVAQDNADGNLSGQVRVDNTVDSDSNGTYVINYTGSSENDGYIVDFAGNRSAINFVTKTVIVGDTNIPDLLLCGDRTVSIEQGSDYFEPRLPDYENDFIDGDLSICEEGDVAFYSSDRTDGFLSLCETNTDKGCVRLFGADSLDKNVPGNYPLTYVAVDTAGNESGSLTRTINVEPATAPSVSLVGPALYLWNQGVNYIDPGVIITDNVDVGLVPTIDTSNVNVFEEGDYPVYINATDNNGNVSETIVRTVQVRDIVPPSILILGENPTYLLVGDTYIDDGATVFDRVGVESFETSGLELVDTSTEGQFDITYTATDIAGNQSTTTRRVIIGPPDFLPPTIVFTDDRVTEFEGDLVIEHEQGSTFNDINFNAADNHTTDFTDRVRIDGTVDENVADDYEITYQVQDDAGNLSREVTVTVRVRDRTSPVITLLGKPEVVIEKSNQSQPYIDPFVEAVDNLDGVFSSEDISVHITRTFGSETTVVDYVDTSLAGEYVIQYTVTDSSSNSATVVRTLTILDVQRPIITLKGENPLYAEQGTSFIDPGARVVDFGEPNIPDEDVIASGNVDITTADSYFRRYNYTDAQGNAAEEVLREVIVSDTTAPSIELNGSQTLQLECGVAAEDPGATAIDLVDGTISNAITRTGALVQEGVAIDTSSESTSSIFYHVSDAANNVATIERIIEIIDTTAPSLTSSVGAEVTHEQGTPFVAPTINAVDLCDGIIETINSDLGNLDINSPQSFTVLFWATDAKGLRSDNFELTVTVEDTLPPSIQLVGGEAIDHEQGTPFEDPGYSAIDAADGQIAIANIQVTGEVIEEQADIYVLSYSATDLAGNTGTATRSVTVKDTQSPTITLSGGTEINHEQGTQFVDPGYSATDVADGDFSINDIVVSGEVIEEIADVYILTYSVTDQAGLTATATRTVTVLDSQPPTITLVSGDAITHEQGTPFVDPGYSATDVADGDFAISDISVSGEVIEETADDYVLTYSVTDRAGNVATATRTVTVTDTIAPEITLLGGSSIRHEQGTPFVDPGYSATDLADGDFAINDILVTGEVIEEIADDYVLTYTVTDRAGLSASETRIVTVSDTLLPVITLVDGDAITHEQGTPFVDPGYSATDIADGDFAISDIVVSGEVIEEIADDYVLTYTVTDRAGLTATATRTVTVRDTQSPIITLVDGDSITHEQGTPFVDPGYSATDAADGDFATSDIIVSGEVIEEIADDYILTYTVTDRAGFIATATRTITVADTLAPVVTLQGGSSISHEQGTPYVDPGYSATDVADGDFATSDILVSGEVVEEVADNYVLTYSVTDRAGLTGSASRTITVIDTLPPQISLVNGNAITHEQGKPFVDPGYSATDLADGEIAINDIVVTGEVVEEIADDYVLTYTVTDSSGLSSSETRTVSVIDTLTPTISLVDGTAITHEQGTPYVDPGYSATDIADGDFATSDILVTGEVIEEIPNDYVLTYTVTDRAGLSGIAYRTVTVVDTLAPEISLVDGNFVTHEQGTPFVDPGYSASDLADGNYPVEDILVTGEVIEEIADDYILSYTVSDLAGNTTTELRTVRVLDGRFPEIVLEGGIVIFHEQGLEYDEPGFTATDLADGVITENVQVTGEVDWSEAGTYYITYTVTDQANNETSIQRTVIVSDTLVPEITLEGELEILLTVGDEFSEPGFQALDQADGNISSQVEVTGFIDTSIPGRYERFYDVEDRAGLKAETRVRTIVVSEQPAGIEAGRITVTNLSSGAASVTFNNSYRSVPAVFIINDISNTAPSDIRIHNISLTGFDLKFDEAQGATGFATGLSTSIDYLVVEPGVYQLSSGDVMEVGLAEISGTVGRNVNNLTGPDTVSMTHTFIDPVILSEIQTGNNGFGSFITPFLTTSVTNYTSGQFNLAMERSEVNSGIVGTSETIAYLAIEKNITSGLTSDGLQATQIQTMSFNTTQGSAPTHCSAGNFNTSFSDVPLVFANKQARLGDNGGWVRRCSVDTASMGVVIDEDVFRDSERGHVSEPIGVLAISQEFSGYLESAF